MCNVLSVVTRGWRRSNPDDDSLQVFVRKRFFFNRFDLYPIESFSFHGTWRGKIDFEIVAFLCHAVQLFSIHICERECCGHRFTIFFPAIDVHQPIARHHEDSFRFTIAAGLDGVLDILLRTFALGRNPRLFIC
jgi:hypothetical protein